MFRIQEFVNILWNPLLNFESQSSVVQGLDAKALDKSLSTE